MRVSHIYTRGAAPPARSLAEKFSYLKSVLGPVSMCVEFQLLALVVSEIIGWSQINTSGRCAPRRPSGKIFIPKKSTWPYLNVCKISIFYLS